MSKIAEPVLFVLFYDFAKWLLDTTAKFPKRVRFTLSTRMDNLALDILEGITEAQFSTKDNKPEILKKTDLQIQRLQILVRMSHDLSYMSHKAYEHASMKLTESGKMIGGWRRESEI